MNKFWIVMFVLALVFIGGGWWFVDRYETGMLDVAMKGEKERIAEYLRGKAVAVGLTREVFQSTDFEVQDAAFKKYWAAIQSPEYVRIKIWNDNFTLVWADLKESIGQRFPDNHEMEDALDGEVEMEIESLGGSENENERQFFKTSEVYVPLYGEQGKEVIGVVEVYKTAHFIDAAKVAVTRMVFTVSIALLFVYGLFGILLYRFFRQEKTVVTAEKF